MHLEVRDIAKRYRRAPAPALDGVSFVVSAGEQLSLIGASGAGKTTLFRLITRSLSPDRGTVLLDGRDVVGLGPRDLRGLRRRIGVVHQRGDLVPNLTALTNTAVGAVGETGTSALGVAMRGATGDLDRRARAALDALEIEDLAGARVDELSGGQRQRVAVARLLVQSPTLVLADEPTASLDPRSGGLILTALTGLAEGGATVLTATHDLDATRTSRRVLALRAGRLSFDGSPRGLEGQPMLDLYAARAEVAPDPRVRARVVSSQCR